MRRAYSPGRGTRRASRASRQAGERTSPIAHSSQSSRAATLRMPPSRTIRNVFAFRPRARRLLADALELAEDGAPVRPLGLQLARRFVRLEKPEEEGSQRSLAPHSPVGLRLAQPAADLRHPALGHRVRLRAARAARRLLDQAVVEEPRELGVDLAVARRPGVRERLLEVLEQAVAGPRLVREGTEECVAERHSLCQT